MAEVTTDRLQLEAEVVHKLKQAGLSVKLHRRPYFLWPFSGLWPFSRGFPRSERYVRAHRKGKTVAIEVITHPVGLGAILRVSALPADRAFIVVPKGEKAKTAGSALDYASQKKVGVYEIDEMDELISSLR